MVFLQSLTSNVYARIGEKFIPFCLKSTRDKSLAKYILRGFTITSPQTQAAPVVRPKTFSRLFSTNQRAAISQKTPLITPVESVTRRNLMNENSIGLIRNKEQSNKFGVYSLQCLLLGWLAFLTGKNVNAEDSEEKKVLAKKLLIFLNTSDVAADPSGKAAQELGFDPVFFCNPIFQADTLAEIQSFKHHFLSEISPKSIRQLLTALEVKSIAGMTSTLNENCLEYSREVSPQFGGASVDPALTKINDKGNLYKLIPEYSPKTVVFTAKNFPYDSLKTTLEKNPLIIKPAMGYSSENVTILKNREDLDKFKASFTQSNDEFLAQTYIEGNLLLLEGYVENGKITFLGFAAENKLGNTETVFEFPVDDQVPDQHKNKAYETVTAIVERSGYENGYFHAQFIVNKDVLFVIDPNFGRIGGGGFGHILASAYGISPVQVYKHVIDIGLFKGKLLGESPYKAPPVKSLGIHYGLPEKATLKKIHLPPTLTDCYHTQIIGNGEKVCPVGVSNWAWLGILVGRSDEVLNQIDRIEIETDSGRVRPKFCDGKFKGISLGLKD